MASSITIGLSQILVAPEHSNRLHQAVQHINFGRQLPDKFKLTANLN